MPCRFGEGTGFGYGDDEYGDGGMMGFTGAEVNELLCQASRGWGGLLGRFGAGEGRGGVGQVWVEGGLGQGVGQAWNGEGEGLGRPLGGLGGGGQRRFEAGPWHEVREGASIWEGRADVEPRRARRASSCCQAELTTALHPPICWGAGGEAMG